MQNINVTPRVPSVRKVSLRDMRPPAFLYTGRNKKNAIQFPIHLSEPIETSVSVSHTFSLQKLVYSFTRPFFYVRMYVSFVIRGSAVLLLKGSDQRENRRVWSDINTRYLVWGCGDGRSFVL